MILVAANPYRGAGPNRRRVDPLVAALAALGVLPLGNENLLARGLVFDVDPRALTVIAT
jgi:hypothetical protein